MAKTPYNTVGYGGAQVLPDNPYSPLTRLLQMGIQPGSAMRKKDRERLEEDQREELDIEDVEAWEDVQSHQEISQELDNLRNVWNEAFSRGYNIAHPTTHEERTLAKMFNKKMDRAVRASDLYKSQGERYGKLRDLMDKEKDRIDMEATQENIKEWKALDPFQRAERFDQLIAWREEPVDVVGETVKLLADMTGTQEDVLSEGIDPRTGKIRVETLHHIPENERIAALRDIWKFSREKFKESVAAVAREDVTFNADPGAPDYMDKLGEWYVDQFTDVKSEKKKRVRMYSVGKGAQTSYAGSGIPEKDPETGVYNQESDTIHTYNSLAGGITPHTSPAVVNLQGQNLYGTNTPSKALQVDVTDDFINTQTGDPEAEAGVYSMLPTKVVWLNVLDEDVKTPSDRPWMNLWRSTTYRKGDVLNDEQLQQVISTNEEMLGSGKYYRYHKVPFVMGRMKYGQVEVGDDIETFNRTTMVPYEVIEKDIRAHKGHQWKQYNDAIRDITQQLNSGWQSAGAKKKMPFDM